MKVAVIGCGLIGKRRASVIHQSPSDELIVVADVDEPRANCLAKEMGCLAVKDWREAVTRNDVQVVVVSTVNKFLMPITVAALERGKHVLCEKPLGRNSGEAQQMVRATHLNGVLLKAGFNHRYHLAISKAHELCASGAIGPLMYIRCVYGHGGRLGYDKEWRADPDLAGGGELLDQGVHIVDLCRWFLGEFSEAVGFTSTYFWDLGYFETAGSRQQAASSKQQTPTSNLQLPIFNLQSPIRVLSSKTLSGANEEVDGSNLQLPTPNLQLEDNAFALLRTADGRVATLHTSWTQWKNRFTFEVFGRDGYVIVEGLGGSYGVERLKVGRRVADGGAPEEQVFEFSERSGDPDMSWQAEWEEFTAAIREKRQPLANGEDGLKAMQLIAAIYESSRTGSVVRLKGD